MRRRCRARVGVLEAGALGAVILLATAGCAGRGERRAMAAGPSPGVQARADIEPLGGSDVRGQARFVEEQDGRVRVVVEATGLTPGQHGMHIHAVGDCSTPQASGGHFDPNNTMRHGAPWDPATRVHAGELPMLVADETGRAVYAWGTSRFTLSPGPASIVKRAIVIHAQPDDYRTNPAGNSGDRIACGVITAGR